MKTKINIAILLLIISTSVFAQTSVYHPFPDSAAVWRIHWLESSANPIPGHVCSSEYQYVLRGDTIIGSNTYSKVYQEGWWDSAVIVGSPPNATVVCQHDPFASNLIMVIRNDIPNKRVYVIKSGFSQEELLYDFSLNAGDTLNSIHCNGVVTGIDSVLVGAQYRKRIDLGGRAIIEGIGYVGDNWGNWGDPFGFLCGPCLCLQLWTFACYSENGTVLYGDSICSVLTDINVLEFNSNKLKVYPNPFHTEMTVEIPMGFGAVYLTMYNSIGNIIQQQYIITSSLIINRGELSSGIYFLKLINNRGEIRTARILIE